MDYVNLYAAIHVVLYFASSFSLCGYMYLAIWVCCDEASGFMPIAFVMPTLGNIATVVVARAIGLTAPLKTKLVVLACDSISFLLAGILDWIFSIKRYRDDGCDPEYSSFWASIVYLALIFFWSAALMFL